MVIHTGKEIIVNHHDIYENIQDAISNWDNSQWENFGKNIGEIVADLTIRVDIVKAPESNDHEKAALDTVKDIEEIFIGVIEGFVEHEAKDVTSCISDAQKAFDDFRNAVT